MATLDVYVVTFNCARNLVDPPTFADTLFHGVPQSTNFSPDIIVLALQEISPIAYSFLGGSFLAPYFSRFVQAIGHINKSLDRHYKHVITRNVGMIGIMVFAKPEVADSIAWMEAAETGVGFWQMGNKGAVGIRIGYTDDRLEEPPVGLEFIAAHLAPFEHLTQRRNEDWKNIVRNLVFEPVAGAKSTAVSAGGQGEQEPLVSRSTSSGDNNHHPGLFSPDSYLFFAGDLNYRTGSTKPKLEDVSRFPQPVNDKANPKHYSTFLPADQLSKEREAGRTLHGLVEAPIDFPPTYKYLHKSPEKDGPTGGSDTEGWNWAQHRFPSWCDRVLYLEYPPGVVEVHSYTALPLVATSDHRAVALAATVSLQKIAQRSQGERDIRLQPPFPINPNWRTERSIARVKEVIVGVLSYLTLTREGNGLVLATVMGAIAGSLIIRSMLS